MLSTSTSTASPIMTPPSTPPIIDTPYGKLSLGAPLANSYYVLRHVHGSCNESNVLVSSVETDAAYKGLSERGLNQLPDCVERLAAHIESKGPLEPIIFTSPLSRGKLTADEVALKLSSVLNRNVGVTVDLRLSERGYGDLDGQSVERWVELRQADTESPSKAPFRAESVTDFARRTGDLLTECEQRHKNACIVMVTHCDTAQVLCAHFTANLGHYSEIRQLGNGEFLVLNDFVASSGPGRR